MPHKVLTASRKRDECKPLVNGDLDVNNPGNWDDVGEDGLGRRGIVNSTGTPLNLLPLPLLRTPV